MSHFDYRGDALHAEAVPLATIARSIGTPTYVYSRAALTENFLAYANACRAHGRGDGGALVCYSVKSNSNLAVLHLLGQLGSGFDIVSGGELLRVIAAGGDPHKVIFSGVGKSRDEMKLALSHDILCFNVESIPELHRLNDVAAGMGKRARVSLRVNPDVDPKTHPYISTGLKENKFGIAFEDALDTYLVAAGLPYIDVSGIDCHIGIGGGIGITYDDEKPVAVGDYLARLFARIDRWRSEKYDGKPISVMFEPGRSIVGNAGVLLTEVQYLKHGATKNFAVVDAAMNDLMRPAMYEAWHGVQPLQRRAAEAKEYDVVGPVCESGDWLARGRKLALEPADLLAIMSAGAYGLTMASNYNTRGRAAEVLVDGDKFTVIRQRENPADLFALESVPK